MSKKKERAPESAADSYVRDRMQKIGRLIDEEIPDKWGFMVIVFPLMGAAGGFNYCSNAERNTALQALCEFLDKAKGDLDWAKHVNDKRSDTDLINWLSQCTLGQWKKLGGLRISKPELPLRQTINDMMDEKS